MFARTRLLLFPPTVAAYAIDRKLRALEAQYPALPADDSTCSPALRTPNSPSTQHSPHIDIFAARIRCKDFIPERLVKKIVENHESSAHVTLGEIWAAAVINSPILRLEGSIIGLFVGRGFNPGDTGVCVGGFKPYLTNPVSISAYQERKEGKEVKSEKRKLLHGALTVERPSAMGNPYGVMLSWKLPDKPRLFFEEIARWGYPWRLMSGGRHEMSLSMPFLIPGLEDEGYFIEAMFASAHDYEIVPGEGDLGRQKTIPEWSARLHRGYARFILDQAAKLWVASAPKK
ncbi:hypothetical protein BDW62DRAFT_63932 [Aspergillus aurantiobrunneus]